MRKCVKLDPKRRWLGRQLARIEKGDPEAEIPYEEMDDGEH
jgi:hypothetical protein